MHCCKFRIISHAPFCNAFLVTIIGISVVVTGCKALINQDRDPIHARSGTDHLTWREYGGGPDQSKYIILDELTKSNVSQLEEAWFYPTGDDKTYQFNPVIIDSIMYVLAKNNSLVALNATTGKEIWIHANLNGIASRGINYWESKDKKDRRIIFQMNNYLQAIDAFTGKSIINFGNNGLVDLKEGLGRDPKTIARVQSGTPGKVFENLVILGSSPGENYLSGPGHLRAYDVITGQLVWTFHTIPQPGEYGYDTWPKEAYKYIGGVNTWGEISLDVNRGIAYFPLGSPTYDYYGGDRHGSNLYGNCILALDARSGKRLWHYQLVHHDLWDYDVTAAPQLITVTHSGKRIDVVAVAGKHGFLFAFDRVTGKPLWPIEERPVPVSDVPGEQSWPTQPYPTVLPPFSRQVLAPEDLSPDNALTPEQYSAWDSFITPQERADWKKRLDTARRGLFTPLSLTQETVSMPGSTGGTNLGNTAANPVKGVVYVMSQSYASIYKKLETRQEIEKEESLLLGEGKPVYEKNCQVCHGANMAGLTGPSLLQLNRKLALKDFKQVVLAGKGKMPAFPHLNENNLKNMYTFLTAGSASGRNNTMADNPAYPEGPVIASGGAPGGQNIRRVVSEGGRFGAPYEGTDTPAVRFYIEGYGLGFPYLMPPPWSEIIAYDLNKGTLKWKVPLGKTADGVSTGLPRGSQRNGMIVTSTGLLFSTARDEKIYAFDADNGKELWSSKLPMSTEGLPSMYAVNGHHYIVVNCSTPPSYWGRQSSGNKTGVKPPEKKGGYLVFALPKKT